MSSMRVFLIGLLAIAACDRAVAPDADTPSNLTYVLQASGDPAKPAGLLLTWSPVVREDLQEYRVYSRASTSSGFDRRASTSSPTFHDNGTPDLEYYVTAVYQRTGESGHSNTIRVDDTNRRLPAPTTLTSISLNSAVHLRWTDNAFQSRPTGFRWYRVYSTSLNIDAAPPLCGATWSLEGTSVSPEFLATALTNGVPRCFGVSAESVEGFESPWSPLRGDTPRPDARNLLMYPYQADQLKSGFRFWLDANGDAQVSPAELGIVTDGNRTDIDFWIYRTPAGDTLSFVPERAGVSVALYGSTPIADLTSIDIAPTTGYSASAIDAVPGFGYVFQLPAAGGFRYGALRVTHRSREYLIFDWSYQTDQGNPELVVAGGLASPQKEGVAIPR